MRSLETLLNSNILNNELFQVVLLTILMALLAIFSARQAAIARNMMLRKQSPKIYVIEVCEGKEIKREYKEGDYVGKVLGECENGTKRVIKAIYVEEAQQPSKTKRSKGLRI
jgi:hypothetical protein